jgi:GAF domain-containing protein
VKTRESEKVNPPLEAADFADMALTLHGQPDLEHTLGRIVELAGETIHSEMCGVMLVHRGNRVETAAVTHDEIAEADRLQFDCKEGPCLEAMDADTTFIIDDTVSEQRWSHWCRAVAGLGIHSVLSVRLATAQGTIGALNVYSRSPGAFDEEDAGVATIFAGHASVALATARTESGLRDAIDGRHVIGVAQGILMERFDLTPEQAFAVLRRYSQDRNTKLRAVAEQLVTSRKLPA